MVRLTFLAVSLFVFVAEASTGLAQQADAGGERRVTERSMDELARGSYSKRQQATLDMWRRRDQTREQVQRAVNHPDPEVASRAKWILRQWRLGALPGTPPEISRLLQRSDNPAAIESLLEAGQFNAANVALEESSGTSEGEYARQRAADALERRFPIYVHYALKYDSLDDLVTLIDRVALSSELALCRLQLLQQMGMEPPEDQWLPEAADTWARADVDRATALMLIAQGQMDSALQVAGASNDSSLLNQCWMMAARWADIARSQSEKAKQADAGGTAFFRDWAMTLIAADRARDKELTRQAVRALASPPSDNASPAVLETRWQTLASHGFVDEAILTAMEANPDDAARLALGAARPKVAFDALGYPLDRVDLELGQWIQGALAAQQTARTGQPVPEIRKILSLMKILISVGHAEAAKEIALKISRSKIMLGTIRLREYLLLTLTNTPHRDWLLEFTVLPNERLVSDVSWNTVSRAVPDGDADTLKSIYYVLSRMFRNSTPRQRFQATMQLCNGEIPDSFDRPLEFRELHDYLTRPDPRRQLPNWSRARAVVKPNVNLVRLFARHGELDLAKSMLAFLVSEGDVDALLMMAEQQLNTGRVEVAGEYFEAVFEQIARPAGSGGRFITATDSATAIKALIGLGTVARRLGDDHRAAELEREVKFGLCTSSVSTRSTVAEYLGQLGATSEAIGIYETALPMAVLGTEGSASVYDVARLYSTLAFESNPDQAVHWFSLAVSGAIEPTEFAPNGYVLLPLFVERWSLETAISRKDETAADLHLRRILQLDPLDVDSAERLLPELRKAGMDSLADEALNELVDLGIKYSADFPLDAMSANNLAWAAAMNGKRLDDALALSRIAVSAEPESATYRDTLAEILFLLGRTREALQVEQNCLLDDPGQWHLHEQIEKFEKALEASSIETDR